MKQTDITFIIPFFGKPPVWMPFFLKSCHHNKDVRFLLFADSLEAGTRGNVEVIRMTLAALKELAVEKLQMQVSLDSPYKICDLRPAFGLIFGDYLKGTRFWGTCDVDIIFGDIRKVITGELMSGYDIITAKQEYLIGHFTLYRNIRKVNLLFKRSAHFREVFRSPRSFAFDECNFLWWKLLAGHPILETRAQVDSMSHVVKRLAATGYIRAYFRSHIIEQDKLTPEGQLEPFSETLIWDEGRLHDLRNNKEYLSFHFHFLKKEPAFVIPAWEKIPDRFTVSQSGFSALDQSVPNEFDSLLLK